MGTYKEFQFGTLLFTCLLLVQILQTYLFVNHLGTRPMGLSIFIVSSAILIISLALFYGMTTVVDNDKVMVLFGIGLIRKSIELKRIQQVDIVRTPWYYGRGIRFIPRGMLYNVSGGDSVELTFYGSKRVIRIGTRDPIQLSAEIQRRLASH